MTNDDGGIPMTTNEPTRLALLERDLTDFGRPDAQDELFRLELAAQLQEQAAGGIAEHRRQPARRRPARKPSWPRRYGLVTLAAAGAVAAAVVVTLVGTSATGGPGNAEAAIIHHAQQALTAPGGVILHERATVTINGAQTNYELWALSDPPHSYRVIKAQGEGAYNGTSFESYDPQRNLITKRPASQGSTYNDPAAEVGQMLASGDAHVLARTQIDGEPVIEISTSGSTDRLLTGTVYVNATTYQPVLIETDAFSAGPERIRFTSYEYLPATPANLSLLDLGAQHPNAPIETAPTQTGTTKG